MTPWLADPDVTLYHGDNLDVLRTLPDKSVHMCATSPPFYGLRDYGHDGQIGLEDTPDRWVARLVDVFREVRRVLRDDGTLWVEIGDSYNSGASGGLGGSTLGGGQENQQHSNRNGRGHVTGHKHKDLIGQPWLLAFALRADGWWLRSEIIWARPNPMPESVTDRPTKSHSTVFLLSKQPRYFYDADAIREQYQKDNRTVTTVKGTDASHQHRNGERWPNETGANARSVWTVPTQPTPFAHFATWPEALCRRMILAGTSERGCCPECGAPWTRDVESERYATRPGNTSKFDTQDTSTSVRSAGQGSSPGNVAFGLATRTMSTRTTTGWSPSCDCYQPHVLYDVQPVPCTVLDPFAGSATTNLVARNHGRHSIGIELNEQYLEIAAKRLQQLSLLA